MGFEFLDLFSATLEGNLFSFVQSELKIFDRSFHVLLHPLQVLRLILFFLQFLSHESSISDGFLGFFFSVSAFRNGFFDFTLSLLEFSLQFSFLVDKSSVLSMEQVGSLVGLVELGLSQFSASFSLFNGVSELFDFTGEEVGSSFDNGHLFTNVFVSSFSLVVFSEVVFDLRLKKFGLFGGFVGLSVGVSELDFQIVEVTFELLLLSDSFGSGFGFGVHGGLHGFESSLTVSSGVVDFFFFLSKSSFEVLFRLRHPDGESKNLSFFGLDGGFSLFKSGLKFVSFLLKSSLGFFELVDRFSTFAELISQISNFFLQVLVLSLDGFKAVEGFFVSVFSLEELSAHASGLLLGSLELNLKFFFFLFVLSNNLVKVPLLLVESSGSGVGSFKIDLKIFDLTHLSLFGLLKRSAFGLGGFDH